MKRAVSYIRISNKDQSNFSLSGQQEYIKQFCDRKQIELVNSFLDNGQSAKNFDRADWKRLEDFVKSNYRDIDHLIVVKYDRFSRNVSEGLNMIDKLEKKYNISVLSVFEEISISPESPFFFKMRTDMLVQAEFELRVIKDRTNFGIRQAKREGRWVTRAPYGYINQRVGNKPEIVVDAEKAVIVKEIFKLFSRGVPMREVLNHVSEMGYSQKSNSAITRILTNPVYMGMLRLDGAFVKGAHKPIIEPEVFNRVQTFFNKESKIKILINDEVPLRGVIKCTCGRSLTAGKSKGKTRYYWYYKCKSHLEINYSANQVESRLKEVLTELSLTAEDIEYIKAETAKGIQKRLKGRQENIPGLKKKIESTEQKLKSVEEKFILSQIPYKSYTSWNNAYNTELNELKSKLKECQEGELNVWERYSKYTNNLTTLLDVYQKIPTVKKQQMLNLVFNRSLKYQLNTFLADYLLPIFASKAPILKQKGLLVINSPSGNTGKFTISSGTGSVVELLEILKESVEC